MSFTVLILNQQEEPLKYLDTEQLEIKQVSEIGELQRITITYPLDTANINLTKELFKIGNKAWVPEKNGLNGCLYVISNSIKYDYWDKNNVELELEEVLVELNYVELFKQYSAETKTINRTLLEEQFGDYFNIGVVEPCMGSRGNVALNGTMTKLGLLRYIEEETSNIFKTRYEKDTENNIIHRYLDFLQPSHAGIEHDRVIDLNFNAENIEHEITESDTYKAIAPVLSLNGSGEAGEVTRADLQTIINEWNNLVVSKGANIPMIIEKSTDENNNVIETVTAYWAAPFEKRANELFIRDDVETEVEYNKILSKGENPTSLILPKIGVIQTSETNKYVIYNICANTLIDKRYPKLNLEVDLKDITQITGDNNFNVYDRLYVKVPGYSKLVRVQISKIEKNPHLLGETKITLANADIGTRINQKATMITASNTTIKKGGFITAVLKTEDELLTDKLCSINITKPETTITTTKNVTTTTTSELKEGTGIHVYMNTDNINSKSTDKKLMNDIADLLRKRGYSVTVGGIGPSTHYKDISKVKKNGIYFTLYGGLCAGTLKEQCYSSHYHSVLKKKKAKMVIGLYNRVLTDKFLPRAHDDNFSPSGFKGWNKPRTNLLNAGIGIAEGKSAKEIASNFPGFKNKPSAKTTTKKTTKPVTTTTTEKAITKTYTAKTDAEGKFKIKVNLNPGDYAVKFNFGGDIEYGASSKEITLKIK